MQQRSLKFNTAMNLLYTAGRFLFPLFIFPYTSRVLGPEGNGKNAFAIAVTQGFILVASVGVPYFGIREIARVRDDRGLLRKTALELFSIHGVSVLIAWLLFLACFASSERLRQEPQLMLAYGAGILLSCFDLSWFFQGLENYTYTTSRYLLTQLLGIVGIVLLVRDATDYVWLGWISLATSLLVCAINLRHFLRQFRHPEEAPAAPAPIIPSEDQAEGDGTRITALSPPASLVAGITTAAAGFNPGRFLGPLRLMALWTLVEAIRANADILMVGCWTDDRTTGLYNASVRLFRLAAALLTCIGAVLLPRLTNCLARGDRKEYDRLLNLSFRFTLTFGLPAVAGILLLAPDLVRVFAGPGFAGAIPSVRLLAPLVLLSGLGSIAGSQVLYPHGKEKTFFWFSAAGALLIITGGGLLIPTYGHIGAAIALLATETVVVGGLLVVAAPIVPLGWRAPRNLLTLLNTAIMTLLVLELLQMTAAWGALPRLALAVAGGLGSYLGLLLLEKDPIIFGPLKPYLQRFSRFRHPRGGTP
jgi:O-antigen/teichoic acid export membrane protein